MKEVFERMLEIIKNCNIPLAILTIIAFGLAFFYAMTVLSKNNARWLNLVFVFYIVITGCIFMSVDTTPSESLMYFFVPLIFIVIVFVMFATDIKRDIWALGAKKVGKGEHSLRASSSSKNSNKNIDEMVKAIQNMSKNNVGAIIILANNNVPVSVQNSGVVVNSDITSALIESIFFPKTPLHDGAMIVNGGRIQSAGCFLPLSQNVNLAKDLGTRHRAGIGITEAVDVISIIVSEESGIISIAQRGQNEEIRRLGSFKTNFKRVLLARF